MFISSGSNMRVTSLKGHTGFNLKWLLDFIVRPLVHQDPGFRKYLRAATGKQEAELSENREWRHFSLTLA